MWQIIYIGNNRHKQATSSKQQQATHSHLASYILHTSDQNLEHRRQRQRGDDDADDKWRYDDCDDCDDYDDGEEEQKSKHCRPTRVEPPAEAHPGDDQKHAPTTDNQHAVRQMFHKARNI